MVSRDEAEGLRQGAEEHSETLSPRGRARREGQHSDFLPPQSRTVRSPMNPVITRTSSGAPDTPAARTGVSSFSQEMTPSRSNVSSTSQYPAETTQGQPQGKVRVIRSCWYNWGCAVTSVVRAHLCFQKDSRLISLLFLLLCERISFPPWRDLMTHFLLCITIQRIYVRLPATYSYHTSWLHDLDFNGFLLLACFASFDMRIVLTPLSCRATGEQRKVMELWIRRL